MAAAADQELREAQAQQQRLLRQYRDPAMVHQATEYRREVQQRVRAWGGFGAGAPYLFGARPGCRCAGAAREHQCLHCGWEACAACAASPCPRCRNTVRHQAVRAGAETPNPDNGNS
jgi:hypothetical protein